MNHPSIDATIQLAERLHRGQRDKAGVPYITHPLAVMRMVSERSWHVAVLHDVMEDCNVTPEELRRCGYSDEEIAAIVLLTRRDGDGGYGEFIERIATSWNTMAIEVKIADLTDNLSPERPEVVTETGAETKARNKRYRRALYRLTRVADAIDETEEMKKEQG